MVQARLASYWNIIKPSWRRCESDSKQQPHREILVTCRFNEEVGPRSRRAHRDCSWVKVTFPLCATMEIGGGSAPGRSLGADLLPSRCGRWPPASNGTGPPRGYKIYGSPQSHRDHRVALILCDLCGYHENRAADPSAFVVARAEGQRRETPCPLQYGPAKRCRMTCVACDGHRTPNLWPRATKSALQWTRSFTELARSSTERAADASGLNLPVPALPAHASLSCTGPTTLCG